MVVESLCVCVCVCGWVGINTIHAVNVHDTLSETIPELQYHSRTEPSKCLQEDIYTNVTLLVKDCHGKRSIELQLVKGHHKKRLEDRQCRKCHKCHILTQ